MCSANQENAAAYWPATPKPDANVPNASMDSDQLAVSATSSALTAEITTEVQRSEEGENRVEVNRERTLIRHRGVEK